jgi:hypothetical protein
MSQGHGNIANTRDLNPVVRLNRAQCLLRPEHHLRLLLDPCPLVNPSSSTRSLLGEPACHPRLHGGRRARGRFGFGARRAAPCDPDVPPPIVVPLLRGHLVFQGLPLQLALVLLLRVAVLLFDLLLD